MVESERGRIDGLNWGWWLWIQKKSDHWIKFKLIKQTRNSGNTVRRKDNDYCMHVAYKQASEWTESNFRF